MVDPAPSGKSADGIVVGANSVGERCVQQSDSPRNATLFCGSWEQPSARLLQGEPATAETLANLANAGAWRHELNARFLCADPVPTTLAGNHPAVLMQCTRRVGGWPYVAFVALANGHAWYADGVTAALPVMQRSLAIMTGQAAGEGDARALTGADALLATRLAAQAMKSGDIGEYEHLMAAGTRANLADSPVAAERAFRAALSLQQKALGADNPNTADPLMLLALQLSNQGQYVEADRAFARADALAARSADPAAPARLLHYRGLHALNQNHPDQALALLGQAEQTYARLVPPDALAARNANSRLLARAGAGGFADMLPDQALLTDPVVQSSLLGIIETRRNQAIALQELGRKADADKELAAAATVARANNLDQPIVTSRLYRTQGMIDGRPVIAVNRLTLSSDNFTRALPGSRSYAITSLLQAGELVHAGQDSAALPICRNALHLLRELLVGVSADLLAPCLTTLHTASDRQPAQAQALLAEMFLAAQSAQSGVTSQQIAEASARLLEGARDPKVAEAIRRQQDATQELSDLYRQRDEVAASRNAGGATPAGAADLDKRVAAGEAALAEADSALQSAAPNYAQLVQEVVPADAVLTALRPNEAFASIFLATNSGWMFLLRDNQVSVTPIDGGLPAIAGLVQQIRASVDIPASNVLPPFATAASQTLYTSLFGGVGGKLDGVTRLTMAPTGPLLSLPFALLLSGPADPGALNDAPWLIRRLALAYVPAPANFVTLRKIAGTSHATRPWFGFGDFQPVTLAQAQHSFPGASCANSARLLAELPKLTFARRELDVARNLFGARPQEELLGTSYTAANIERSDLANYQILHFASHALLPSEIACEDQPAIVTSAPPGASDASGALLTASDIAALKLDADLVVLSACNSGGPAGGQAGTTAGESLSGLARAFFYAGARGLLVTHWSVNDQASAFLVLDTMQRARAGKDSGEAGDVEQALRQAQLGLLQSTPHPFYWAAFALIGEGKAAGQVGL
jgi:CHAT domain-containing protein